MQYSTVLKLWYCKSCGCYASSVLRELGKGCTAKVTPTRGLYLSRISRGLVPQCLSAAEKRTRGHV
eukprot:3807883-Pyramimonas_sp.AAC.1